MAGSKTIHIGLIGSIMVDPKEIDQNTGQIPGVPSNPRQAESEYLKLKASMTADADFTGISEIALYPYDGRYVAIHGNLRARAARELGWESIPAKVIPADTPPEALARFILLGNADFGKWDFGKLINEWADTGLEDLCIEVPADAKEMAEIDPDELGEEFELNSGERNDERKMTFTLSAFQDEFINRIIEEAKASGLAPDPRYGNSNEDANYIHMIARQWEEQKKSS